MPYFQMNRDVTINSTLGAAINFTKDKPEFAPEFMRAEVEARGAEEVDAPEGVDEEPGSGSGEEGSTLPAAPTDQAERDAAMHAAFEQMVVQGTAGDSHTPTVSETSAAVGFKVTAAERDAAWESFKAGS